MSTFRHHQSKHNNLQVRFLDDSQLVSDIGLITTAKYENVTSKAPEAPRFPNLQMMFRRQKGAIAKEEEVIEKVEVIKNRDDQEKKVVKKQENVDMEAGEYIKRKRHNLSLQKLNSISAA